MTGQALSTVTFCNMGLFTTDLPWIHPSRTEKTYEIICPITGTVHLRDGGQEFSLTPGDLIILRPNVHHEGSRESIGATSFYWLHFFATREAEIPYLLSDFRQTALLRELLHFSSLPDTPSALTDAIFRHLFALIVYHDRLKGGENRLASEVFEWLRINASGSLSVADCARRFGYNAEYLSRVVAAQYGMRMKALINRFLCERAKALLSNTALSVKEIASALRFPDGNAFLHFFRYHEKSTPTAYRKQYTATHMNNR